MKMMTIVVKFEDGESPTPVTFGDKVLGGAVTGLASYDVMHTMEIAEDLIENSTDNKSIETMEKINSHIVHGIYQEI